MLPTIWGIYVTWIMYWYWIYHANTGGRNMSLKLYIRIGLMLPTICGVHVSHIYICWYWKYAANNLGSMCQLNIYILVLDISCQHLGDECKLEGFCVPFGHRVGECTISEMFICIGNMLPTIWGVCISWIYMLVLDISCQHLGDECKLEGFCVPFGHKVGECTILEMYNCIGYMLPTIWGVCFNWKYRLILAIWCTTCETFCKLNIA